MNKYTLYCTEAQTRKALKLGAPLLRQYGTGCSNYIDMLIISDTEAYTIPTAEEMIGWLEEQGIQISIIFCYQVSPLRWNYDLDNTNIILFEHDSIGYPSRQEATLAAIDAALAYLTNE